MYQLILVDDEPLAAEQLRFAFDWEGMGFHLVECFTSGKKAMNYIKGNPVDAMITDIKMPGVSGLDLAKFCYEYYPNIGVILFTAHRDFEFAQQGIQYNVIDYLLKPLEEEALMASLRKLQRHLLNQQRIIERPSSYSYNMITQEAVSYIKKHFNENITVEDVARHVLISPKYFGAYFKKSYGKNFVEFLREVRMTKAAELLKDNGLIISAIAEMVGYKSATHFYDIFQNYYGLTPAQFRKQGGFDSDKDTETKKQKSADKKAASAEKKSKKTRKKKGKNAAAKRTEPKNGKKKTSGTENDAEE